MSSPSYNIVTLPAEQHRPPPVSADWAATKISRPANPPFPLLTDPLPPVNPRRGRPRSEASPAYSPCHEITVETPIARVISANPHLDFLWRVARGQVYCVGSTGHALMSTRKGSIPHALIAPNSINNSSKALAMHVRRRTTQLRLVGPRRRHGFRVACTSADDERGVTTKGSRLCCCSRCRRGRHTCFRRPSFRRPRSPLTPSIAPPPADRFHAIDVVHALEMERVADCSTEGLVGPPPT